VEVQTVSDHVRPISDGGSTRLANKVASCSVCNGLKHMRVFGSVDEARSYVALRRKEKGYTPDSIWLGLAASLDLVAEETAVVPEVLNVNNEQPAGQRSTPKGVEKARPFCVAASGNKRYRPLSRCRRVADGPDGLCSIHRRLGAPG
jgi:hypothetical protein